MADACECGNEPSGSVKCGEFLDWLKLVSFSKRTLHHGVSKKVGPCIVVWSGLEIRL